MSKNTNSTLSINTETFESLNKLGQRMRANRVAQGWTIKDMASRLFCSQNTYRAIEAGKPTASIGIVVNALWLFGQIDSLDGVAPIPINLNTVKRVRNQVKKHLPGVISEGERDF